MGNSNNCSGKAVQVILQHRQCRNIQVVRRLVQQQHVRRRHKHTQKIQTTLLAAAELINRHPLQLRREQKALQHLRRADTLAVCRFNVIIRFLDIFQNTHAAVRKLAMLCKITNFYGLPHGQLASCRRKASGNNIHQR